jgi:hypothetical protein
MENLKTAICKVKFDGWDWLNKFEIISPTGKRIFFEFNIRNQVSLRYVKETYPVLTEKLYSHSNELGFFDVEFTYDEMRILLAISKYELKEK